MTSTYQITVYQYAVKISIPALSSKQKGIYLDVLIVDLCVLLTFILILNQVLYLLLSILFYYLFGEINLYFRDF